MKTIKVTLSTFSKTIRDASHWWATVKIPGQRAKGSPRLPTKTAAIGWAKRRLAKYPKSEFRVKWEELDLGRMTRKGD